MPARQLIRLDLPLARARGETAIAFSRFRKLQRSAFRSTDQPKHQPAFGAMALRYRNVAITMFVPAAELPALKLGKLFPRQIDRAFHKERHQPQFSPDAAFQIPLLLPCAGLHGGAWSTSLNVCHKSPSAVALYQMPRHRAVAASSWTRFASPDLPGLLASSPMAVAWRGPLTSAVGAASGSSFGSPRWLRFSGAF